MATNYLDHNGDLVFVSSGISSGTSWMTVRVKDGKTGSHRIKSPHLPIRHTKEEAQKDLDDYAKSKGWKPDAGEPAENQPEPAPAKQEESNGAKPPPPRDNGKTIEVCERCFSLIKDSFPRHKFTAGEKTEKSKCQHCRHSGPTTVYLMEKKEKVVQAA